MIVNKEHLAIASSSIPYILAIIGYAQMIYKQYLRRNDRKVYSSRYFPNNMRAFVIPLTKDNLLFLLITFLLFTKNFIVLPANACSCYLYGSQRLSKSASKT